MPIGDTLAQARQQAGLTVTQVSKRTRIRETIIRKIEADDYSECGGDFYTRGHIRAIAKVVGADPEPLIQEYDTRYREPGAIGTVSLEELLAASGRAGQRHPPDLPAARARATAPREPAWRANRPRLPRRRRESTRRRGTAPGRARRARRRRPATGPRRPRHRGPAIPGRRPRHPPRRRSR